MRHTCVPSKWAEIALSLRLFRGLRSAFLCVLAVGLPAGSAYGQTPMLTTPQSLLGTDPRALGRWLETDRPRPVSPQDRLRILSSLPVDGEITRLDASARTKLAAVKGLLRATGRDAEYEIKVVEVPQVRIAVHERTVILISGILLNLLDADELRALAAHELGHEYLRVEYARASRIGDYHRLAELELLCDAIAIVTLHRLHLNPARLMTGIEKVARYNDEIFPGMIDERAYPSLAERRSFAREIIAWVAPMQTPIRTSGRWPDRRPSPASRG
jgi:hypothetical protein